MKTFFNFSILWVFVVCTNPLWASVGETNDIPRLANRIGSESRSLQKVEGRLKTQHLTINRDSLEALVSNRLDTVIIPVIEDDVIFHKDSQKIRKKTATWTGRDKTGQARVLLTLGDDHFFARVVADGKTILYRPAGVDNQVVSYCP